MQQKIGKLINALTAVLRKPYLLNAVLESEDLWKDKLAKRYPDKQQLPDLPFVDICGLPLEPAEPFACLEGGSLPTDLSLLRSLARKFPECRYFEIGTWRGESVANVASIAKECVTVNLSPQEIINNGGSADYADAHFFFSRKLENVRQILCSTLDLNFEALNTKFDLVFIDGDHHYNMICHDTLKVFKHLIHDHTIVVWHDYATSPEKVRSEVLMGILDSLPASLHPRLFHVSNTLCAVYLPFEAKGRINKGWLQPEGHYKLDLSWCKD